MLALRRSTLKTQLAALFLKAPRMSTSFSQRAWGGSPLAEERESIVRGTALNVDLNSAPVIEPKVNQLWLPRQLTSRVMMVEPSCFNYNPQTAKDNAFQRKLTGLSGDAVHKRAMHEFEQLSKKLAHAGVAVNRTKDTQQRSEDAVFPNNWISFHEEADGRRKIVLYPMMSERRRLERRKDLVSEWKHRLGAEVVDYTQFENEGKFLEGTGSMVLDRVNKRAYACESQRTHKDLFHRFCHDLGYSPFLFKSYSRDEYGMLSPIYHTNVMMSVGASFAIVCLESIIDVAQRNKVHTRLKEDGKTIVPITLEQVNHFAGNVLQVKSCVDDCSYLVMSTQAYHTFTDDQKEEISKHVDGIIHSSLETIETLGGGGARCMLAEVFPPN